MSCCKQRQGSRGTASQLAGYPYALPSVPHGLQDFQVDFVILAGYLKLIPSQLCRAFRRRILNIHPGLLPSFGGKGYYGIKVRVRGKGATQVGLAEGEGECGAQGAAALSSGARATKASRWV